MESHYTRGYREPVKPFIMSAAAPVVLLLTFDHGSLFDHKHRCLLSALGERTYLARAKTPSDAFNYLYKNKPNAVIITEPHCFDDENIHVLELLKAYAWGGGTVIAVTYRAGKVRSLATDRIWEAFDLPWKSSPDYVYAREVLLHPDIAQMHNIPEDSRRELFQDGAYLENVPPGDVWFKPVMRTDGNMLLPDSTVAIEEEHTAVASTTYGCGTIGYIGGIILGPWALPLMLRLCGL